MPALFKEGFFIREAAWHHEGIVLEGSPDRDEAMVLAGHDFVVEEEPVYTASHGKVPGFKALIKHYPGREHPEEGAVLYVPRSSYGVVQNEVMWDLAYAVAGEGAKIETGVTLGDTGAELAITLWLDEPAEIPGDDSPIFPFCVGSWNHDGSGKGRVIGTSVRVVCANTNAAANAQGETYGTIYEFTHSSRVMDHIKAAQETVRGMRANHHEYLEMARELADIKITESQRELFLCEFVPMPLEAQISNTVVKNIDTARQAIRDIIASPTVPEAHKLTGYGLHLAGVEFLDHVRPFRSHNSYTRRCLLKPDKAKAKLTGLIKEVAVA